MDRKHGKYVVNIEHSGNQPVSTGGASVTYVLIAQSLVFNIYTTVIFFLLQHDSFLKGILKVLHGRHF